MQIDGGWSEQINSSGQEVTDLMLMCDEASAETANKWLQKFQTDLPETKLEIVVNNF